MIEHLQGKMVEKSPTHVVVDCNGVGYYVNISLTTYTGLGDKEAIKLNTHLSIREDAHTLYGFSSREERVFFRHLISVSGVGAATAMMVLSSLNPAELQNAILEDNVNLLKSVKGIGAKSAQRIIIDLRDKLGKETLVPNISGTGNNTSRDEALSALLALGFDRSSSGKTLDKIIQEDSSRDWPVEQLIKTALKQL